MMQEEPQGSQDNGFAPGVAFTMLTKKAGRDDRSRAVQVCLACTPPRVRKSLMQKSCLCEHSAGRGFLLCAFKVNVDLMLADVLHQQSSCWN